MTPSRPFPEDGRESHQHSATYHRLPLKSMKRPLTADHKITRAKCKHQLIVKHRNRETTLRSAFFKQESKPILPDARGRQIDYTLTPSHVPRLLLLEGDPQHPSTASLINSGPSRETLLAARGLAWLVRGWLPGRSLVSTRMSPCGDHTAWGSSWLLACFGCVRRGGYL